MNDTRAHRAARRRSDGFTLIELLIGVVITGILCTAMASAIVVVLRNMESTTSRIDNSQDAQRLVSWLPVDVSSTPLANMSTDPSLDSGCASTSPGTNVLQLTWSEAINGTTTSYIADYRLAPVPGGSDLRLLRYSCSGVGSMGAAKSVIVSNPIAALPEGWTPGHAPVAVTTTGNIVTFTLTQADGHIARVEAAHKNPAATLPPSPTTTPMVTTTTPATTTTVAGTTTTSTTSTTTTSTTTTIPATTTTIPCVVGAVTASPTSMGTHSKAPNQLQGDVTITITWSGDCQLLQLQYDTGGSMGLLYQNFTTTSPHTVTLRGFKNGGTEIWTSGTHTLSVIDNNKKVLAQTSLVVS